MPARGSTNVWPYTTSVESTKASAGLVCGVRMFAGTEKPMRPAESRAKLVTASFWPCKLVVRFRRSGSDETVLTPAGLTCTLSRLMTTLERLRSSKPTQVRRSPEADTKIGSVISTRAGTSWTTRGAGGAPARTAMIVGVVAPDWPLMSTARGLMVSVPFGGALAGMMTVLVNVTVGAAVASTESKLATTAVGQLGSLCRLKPMRATPAVLVAFTVTVKGEPGVRLSPATGDVTSTFGPLVIWTRVVALAERPLTSVTVPTTRSVSAVESIGEMTFR